VVAPHSITLLAHTKYVGRSIGHKDNVKFSEDGETVVEGTDVD